MPQAVQASTTLQNAREHVTTTGKGVTHAASTPLRDFGLSKEEIPPAVASAVMLKYAPPETCAQATVLVRGFDAVLGDDIDRPEDKDDDGLIARGAVEASKLIIGAAKDEVTGLIPFRGLVRRVSGAKAHEKKVQNAIYVAHLRRAFLKGWANAQGCPQFLPDPEPKPLPAIDAAVPPRTR